MQSLADFLDSASIPEVTTIRPLALVLSSSVLVMPHADGQNLRDALRGGRPRVAETMRLAGEVLARIHAAPFRRRCESGPCGGRARRSEDGRRQIRAIDSTPARRGQPGDVVTRIPDHHPNNNLPPP
jgi:hypothetical protein